MPASLLRLVLVEVVRDAERRRLKERHARMFAHPRLTNRRKLVRERGQHRCYKLSPLLLGERSRGIEGIVNIRSTVANYVDIGYLRKGDERTVQRSNSFISACSSLISVLDDNDIWDVPLHKTFGELHAVLVLDVSTHCRCTPVDKR